MENKICPYEKILNDFEPDWELDLIFVEKYYSGYPVKNRMMCGKTEGGRLLKRLFP